MVMNCIGLLVKCGHDVVIILQSMFCTFSRGVKLNMSMETVSNVCVLRTPKCYVCAERELKNRVYGAEKSERQTSRKCNNHMYILHRFIGFGRWLGGGGGEGKELMGLNGL